MYFIAAFIANNIDEVPKSFQVILPGTTSLFLTVMAIIDTFSDVPGNTTKNSDAAEAF